MAKTVQAKREKRIRTQGNNQAKIPIPYGQSIIPFAGKEFHRLNNLKDISGIEVIRKTKGGNLAHPLFLQKMFEVIRNLPNYKPKLFSKNTTPEEFLEWMNGQFKEFFDYGFCNTNRYSEDGTWIGISVDDNGDMEVVAAVMFHAPTQYYNVCVESIKPLRKKNRLLANVLLDILAVMVWEYAEDFQFESLGMDDWFGMEGLVGWSSAKDAWNGSEASGNWDEYKEFKAVRQEFIEYKREVQKYHKILMDRKKQINDDPSIILKHRKALERKKNKNAIEIEAITISRVYIPFLKNKTTPGLHVHYENEYFGGIDSIETQDHVISHTQFIKLDWAPENSYVMESYFDHHHGMVSGGAIEEQPSITHVLNKNGYKKIGDENYLKQLFKLYPRLRNIFYEVTEKYC